jgi:hypothetical protein
MGDDSFGQLGDGFTSNSLLPEQIDPSPQPALVSTLSFKTNLLFEATCQFGATFYLLTSMDTKQPLSQWTRVWTNSITVRGTNNFAATLTDALNSIAERQFYVLQSQ